MLNEDVHHPQGPQEGGIERWQMRSLALQLKSLQMSSDMSTLWKQQWCCMADNTRSACFIFHCFPFTAYFFTMYYRRTDGRDPACPPCPWHRTLLRKRGSSQLSQIARAEQATEDGGEGLLSIFCKSYLCCILRALFPRSHHCFCVNLGDRGFKFYDFRVPTHRTEYWCSAAVTCSHAANEKYNSNNESLQSVRKSNLCLCGVSQYPSLPLKV